MMRFSTALTAIFLALSPAMANATTVGFTYNGTDPDDSYVTTTGTGTISFNGTGALTLSSLTGFSFAQTTTLSEPGLSGSGNFTYSLADLTSFAGVFNNGAFSSLDLRTRTGTDGTGFLADQSFQIRSLRVNGASTAFDDSGSDQATLGMVSLAAPVPEPTTWEMMILGMGAAGFVIRRREKRVAPLSSVA